MKKRKFNTKLSLNKETIAKLNNESMSRIYGGSHYCETEVNTCTCGDLTMDGKTCNNIPPSDSLQPACIN